MSGASISVTLPSGLWQTGAHHRVATLRPMSGADEIFLIEASPRWPLARRVSELLARCVEAVGTLAPTTPDVIAALTVGDREALLLHVRALTYGAAIDCVLACPGCGERLDLTLHTEELLLPPYLAPAPRYTLSVGERDELTFRLATGADQEVIAAFAAVDLAAAATELARRCLDLGAGAPPNAEIQAYLSAAMAERDPQAELLLNHTCPACNHSFSTLFDTAMFLFDEVAARAGLLFREVHALARTYHWSEAEILSLSFRRRQTYLALLDEQ